MSLIKSKCWYFKQLFTFFKVCSSILKLLKFNIAVTKWSKLLYIFVSVQGAFLFYSFMAGKKVEASVIWKIDEIVPGNNGRWNKRVHFNDYCFSRVKVLAIFINIEVSALKYLV